MKLTSQEEDRLEEVAVLEIGNWPFGEDCPACKRPHLFTYSDGSKVCDKCDEVVSRGSVLEAVT